MAFDDGDADLLAELYNEHGESVGYQRSGGAAASVRAFYDADGGVIDDGTLVGTVRAHPRLTLQSASVPLIAEGDSFTVRGIGYLVSTVMPPNHGEVEAWLRRSS